MIWSKPKSKRAQHSILDHEAEIVESMGIADRFIYYLRRIAQTDDFPIEHFREATQTLYQLAARDFHRSSFLGITQIRHGQNAIISTLVDEIIQDTPFTVIDIGANDGWFIEKIQKSKGMNHLLAFEPITDLIEGLRSKFSSDQRMQFYQTAIGNESGTKELFVYQQVNGLSSLLDFKEDYHFLGDWFDASIRTTLEVKTTTLDAIANNYLPAIHHPRIALKIDVQGFEWQVLEGADLLLRTGRVKAILIELMTRSKYEGSETMLPILNRLDDLGFIVFDIHPFYREQNMIFQESHRGRLTELDCLLVHKDYLTELDSK